MKKVFKLTLFYFLFILITQGCNPIKNATQKVLTDTEAFNTVGHKWAELNPCVVDSTWSSGVDSTISYDTTYNDDVSIDFNEENDLVYHPYTNPIDTSIYNDIIKRYSSISWPSFIPLTGKTITITKKYHDTTKVFVTDERQLRIYQDSNLILHKTISENNNKISSLKHTASVRLWILIGIGVVALIYIFRKTILGFITGGFSSILNAVKSKI